MAVQGWKPDFPDETSKREHSKKKAEPDPIKIPVVLKIELRINQGKGDAAAYLDMPFRSIIHYNRERTTKGQQKEKRKLVFSDFSSLLNQFTN